jgi:hypothetical protein
VEDVGLIVDDKDALHKPIIGSGGPIPHAVGDAGSAEHGSL